MENEVKEPAVKYNYISPGEYLVAERIATEKHAYFNGEVVVISGASKEHNSIAKNFSMLVLPFLKGKNCAIFGSDLRVHIPEKSLYTYPDFTTIYGEWETVDSKKDTVMNPSLIVEILSKSTWDYNRGKKLTFTEVVKPSKYIS